MNTCVARRHIVLNNRAVNFMCRPFDIHIFEVVIWEPPSFRSYHFGASQLSKLLFGSLPTFEVTIWEVPIFRSCHLGPPCPQFQCCVILLLACSRPVCLEPAPSPPFKCAWGSLREKAALRELLPQECCRSRNIEIGGPGGPRLSDAGCLFSLLLLLNNSPIYA